MNTQIRDPRAFLRGTAMRRPRRLSEPPAASRHSNDLTDRSLGLGSPPQLGGAGPTRTCPAMSPGLPSVPLPGALAAPAAMCGPPFPSVRPDRLATALAGWSPSPATAADTTRPPCAGSNRRPSTPPDPRSSCNSRNGSGPTSTTPRSYQPQRRQRLTPTTAQRAAGSLSGPVGRAGALLDLATLRVGIPQTDGSTQGLSLAFLAEKPVWAGAGPNGPAATCARPDWSPSTPRPTDRGQPLSRPTGHSRRARSPVPSLQPQ